MKNPSVAVAAAAVAPPVVPSPATASTPRSGASPSPLVSEDLAKRVAEAKRKVAEAQSKLAIKDNPYMVRRCLSVG